MSGEIQEIEIEQEIKMGKVNWSYYTPVFLTIYQLQKTHNVNAVGGNLHCNNCIATQLILC